MAELKQVITIIDKEERTYGLNSSNLVQSNNSVEVMTADEVAAEKRKRGPGRPPKNSPPITYTSGIIEADNKKKNSPSTEIEKGYDVTTKLLYGAIAQADNMYNNLDQELNNFRSNSHYGGRNRMETMSNFMNTQVGLINTKVSAIRELNSSRSKINDLIMKREQMLKDTGEENSDKAVMDAYYAFINAPRYGLPTVNQALSPSSLNTGVNLAGQAIPTTSIGGLSGVVSADPTNQQAVQNTSFESYTQNLSPIQKRMIVDKDPNIKTVVVYDQSTGMKYFDVVNVSTGQSIPGVQKPAEFLLDTMRIDARNGIAVNSNANMTFPLVLVGMRAADEL